MTNFFKDLKNLKFNYKLGKKTWFGSGGNSTFFIEINSLASLQKLLKVVPYFVPIFVLGAGSNIIVRDGGFNGLTIKLSGIIKKINYNKNKRILTIGGAAKDSTISRFCEQNSITDFEFLRGIPGTLGGNIKMNAGCYGKTISDNLIDCNVISRNGKVSNLKKEEIKFSYRKTSLDDDLIITSANFKVKLFKKKQISYKMKRIIKKRSSSQPVNYRTGGSTFKNPPNQSAWKLIDKINYRGKNIGDAYVSEKHANFLINNNYAKSIDLEILGEEIREKVKKKYNINLDWELLRIGKFKKI
jgi:UDP-N-acetylmuramate dehydrogenase